MLLNQIQSTYYSYLTHQCLNRIQSILCQFLSFKMCNCLRIDTEVLDNWLLTIKNECLQVKLLHRLHSAPEAPWPRWVWAARDGRASLGPHWRHLEALMPLYRSISRVSVGNGRCTAFWLDAWLPGGALRSLLPALFSHALNARFSRLPCQLAGFSPGGRAHSGGESQLAGFGGGGRCMPALAQTASDTCRLRNGLF
jgi:hypothetical protein